MTPERQVRAFRQIVRVLRPGGVACIDENRYCYLREDDPAIEELVAGLPVKLYLATGTVNKQRTTFNPDGTPIKKEQTSKFLFLLKHPIDPQVLSWAEGVDFSKK